MVDPKTSRFFFHSYRWVPFNHNKENPNINSKSDGNHSIQKYFAWYCFLELSLRHLCCIFSSEGGRLKIAGCCCSNGACSLIVLGLGKDWKACIIMQLLSSITITLSLCLSQSLLGLEIFIVFCRNVEFCHFCRKLFFLSRRKSWNSVKLLQITQLEIVLGCKSDEDGALENPDKD